MTYNWTTPVRKCQIKQVFSSFFYCCSIAFVTRHKTDNLHHNLLSTIIYAIQYPKLLIICGIDNLNGNDIVLFVPDLIFVTNICHLALNLESPRFDFITHARDNGGNITLCLSSPEDEESRA